MFNRSKKYILLLIVNIIVLFVVFYGVNKLSGEDPFDTEYVLELLQKEERLVDSNRKMAAQSERSSELLTQTRIQLEQTQLLIGRSERKYRDCLEGKVTTIESMPGQTEIEDAPIEPVQKCDVGTGIDQSEIDSLNAQLDEVKNELDQARSKLTEDDPLLSQEIKQLNDKVLLLNETNNKLSKKVQAHNKSNQQLSDKIASLSQANEQMNINNPALSQTIEQLNQKNQSLSETNVQLTEKVQLHDKTSKELTDKIQLLSKTNDQLTEKAQLHAKTSKELTDKIQLLSQTNEKLTEKIQLLTDTNKQLTAKIQLLSTTSEALTDKNLVKTQSKEQLTEQDRLLSQTRAQLEEKELLLKQTREQLAQNNLLLSQIRSKGDSALQDLRAEVGSLQLALRSPIALQKHYLSVRYCEKPKFKNTICVREFLVRPTFTKTPINKLAIRVMDKDGETIASGVFNSAKTSLYQLSLGIGKEIPAGNYRVEYKIDNQTLLSESSDFNQ